MLVYYVALLLAAQAAPIEPLGSFDLHLQRGDSIKFFVARNAQLYFAVSTANGPLVFKTTEDGALQSINSLGAERISGFDMDAAGNPFVLFGDSHLTEFDSEWRVKQTLTLQTPVTSFAIVNGRPMGVGPDSKLGYMDASERRFTLAAYPAPLSLFGAGGDRLGVLRQVSPPLLVFHLDGLGADIQYAGKAIAATATPEGTIYLLGPEALVTECDDHGKPRLAFELAPAEQFNPRLFAVTDKYVNLVDPGGRVVWYARPSAPATRAIDAFPELLSDMEPLRAAVRKTGYTDPIEIKLTVSEKGIPQNIQLPISLAGVPAVRDAVEEWHFKPAIKSGRPAAAPMSFYIR